MSEICQNLLIVSVVMARADPKGELGVCILPPAVFKNVFDAYNFSIISNFCDSDKLYAIRTHNQKCAKKMHHIWRSTQKLRSKNLNKICEKIIQKALKQPLQHVNFEKFSGAACSRTPLESFWFLNQLQISSAQKNKLETM